MNKTIYLLPNKTRLLKATASLLFFLTPWSALADDFQVTPEISLKQEYTDNLLFTATNELEDFITTVSPALRISEKTERLDASINSKLDAVGYADNDVFNAFETDHDAQVDYKLTPLVSISASAAYKQDSRPDRDIETSGLVLNTSKRQNQLYSVGGNWVATEAFQVGASYSYGRSDFDDINLTDSKTNGAGIGLAVNLEEYLPKTIGRSNFSYTRYNFTSTVTKMYLATLGFDYNVTEKYTLSAEAGPRYSESDANGVNGDDWGIGGNVSFDMKLDELTDLSFSLSQEQTDVSGSSGTTDRTSVSTSYNRRIYREFSLGLSAEYRKNKSESSVSSLSTDEDFYSISPRLTYRITDDLSLQTVYRFTSIDQKNVSGGSVSRERNLLLLRLTSKFPLLD